MKIRKNTNCNLIIKLALISVSFLTLLKTNVYADNSSLNMPNIVVDLDKDSISSTQRMPSIYLRSLQRTYSNYNLSDNLAMQVKDQGQTETCWACSSNSVLETTVNKANNTNHVFSHTYLDEKVHERYGGTSNDGANALMAYSYYNSGELPQNMENEKVNVKIDDYTLFPTIYKTYEDGIVTYKNANSYSAKTYTQDEIATIRNLIKQHIMEKGAVTALNCSDEKYYSDNLEAYYCNEVNYLVNANHQITIVGWDDNYAVENFNENSRPINKGAYIVLNSYGTGFGNNGYIYVSYEDRFIENAIFGIDETSSYENENIYQYDELGMNNSITFTNDNIYAANVFERSKDIRNENLTEIAVSTFESGEYDIYINSVDGELSENKLKFIKTVKLDSAGYKTIKLDTPIKLTGEKFVIAYKSKKTQTSNPQIGIEYNDGNNWKNASNMEGQSYLGLSLTEWYDVTTLSEVNQALPTANITLKAFTDREKREYKIDGEYIENILPNTTTEELSYNLGTTVTTTNDIIKSGDKILLNGNEYTAVVLGDITLNSNMDIQDLSAALQHFANKAGYILSGVKLKSADVNLDDEVDIRDLSKMMLVIANINEL